MGIPMNPAVSETQGTGIHQDLTLGLIGLPDGKMQPARNLRETALHRSATEAGGQIDIDSVHLAQGTQVKNHRIPVCIIHGCRPNQDPDD